MHKLFRFMFLHLSKLILAAKVKETLVTKTTAAYMYMLHNNL